MTHTNSSVLFAFNSPCSFLSNHCYCNIILSKFGIQGSKCQITYSRSFNLSTTRLLYYLEELHWDLDLTKHSKIIGVGLYHILSMMWIFLLILCRYRSMIFDLGIMKVQSIYIKMFLSYIIRFQFSLSSWFFSTNLKVQ